MANNSWSNSDINDNYSEKAAKSFAQLNASLKTLSELSDSLPVEQSLEEEDFIEIIDWSGAPVKLEEKPSKSSSFVSKISSVFYPSKQTEHVQTEVDCASGSTSHSLVDHANYSVNKISIEDVINQTKCTTHAQSFESKYSKLKQQFEHYKHSKRRPADFTETIRDLNRGNHSSLDLYRTKDDKRALLDEAVASFDGNTISRIVSFLRSTLSDVVFYELLKNNNIAADHYLQYVRQICKYDELIRTLLALDRKEEAAIIEFNLIAKKQNITVKIQCLKKFLENYFDSNSMDDCQLIVDYAHLLERLQAFPNDAQDDTSGHEPFAQSSVMDLLYYCSFHHFDLPSTSFTSPLSVRDCHHLTERQNLWIVFKALCAHKRWNEIEKIFHTKNSFGSTQIKTIVGLEKVVAHLANCKAPKNVLLVYFKEISDPVKRDELSRNFEELANLNVNAFHDSSSKEKSNLLTYVTKLVPNAFS